MTEPFRSSIERLDRLLESRVRLAVCALLSRHEEMSFSRLKELTGQTDGNLGAHLRKLEDAGYIEVRKEFRDRRPVSWYALTPEGGHALEAHMEALSELLKGV